MRTSSEDGNHKRTHRARATVWTFITLLLALGISAPAMAAGACGGKPCVSTRSVVGAAGDDLHAALAQVEFAGDGLAPQSKDAIASIAKTWAAQSKKVLALRVLADTGLKGAAARTQAAARGKALTQALVEAGLSQKQIKIVH